jgi:uncharacterized protein YggE
VDREIVVRGEGKVRVMPDRASVRLMVDGEGSSRDDAYQVAARIAKSVDGVLEAGTPAVERVTTTALVVQPRTRWRKGETIRTGWRAYRSSVVEIRDLDQVGDLLAKITAAGGAISALTWELDGSNAGHDVARGLAGEDARRRAERYASSLGVLLGGVSWAAEPGLRMPQDQFSAPLEFAAARPAMVGGRPDEETIEVTPEEITLRVAIEVGFSFDT